MLSVTKALDGVGADLVWDELGKMNAFVVTNMPADPPSSEEKTVNGVHSAAARILMKNGASQIPRDGLPHARRRMAGADVLPERRADVRPRARDRNDRDRGREAMGDGNRDAAEPDAGACNAESVTARRRRGGSRVSRASRACEDARARTPR
jgi:hypothetical protein